MSHEQPAPYASGQTPPTPRPAGRVRIGHLAQAKAEGRRFAMLTAYDQYSASIFEEAGIEVLLVGDSAANNVMGHATTLPITLDEMGVFARSVTAGAKRSLVVCDLPFGTFEASPQLAVESSVRLMKETGIHAVKMEGTARRAAHVQAVVEAGIPVMAHIGFTPQAEHALGGYKVQGRGEAAQRLIDDARALEAAGAFCVLLEMVPAEVAAAVDAAVSVPTIGIGAGSATTGQVLVWQDMMGLNPGKLPRFVKKYADLRQVMGDAAAAYHRDVLDGSFPADEHGF
ncbi:3-methyl-2-oxobutanoate hydroxymethyltransferase [Arthrobacter sp. JSM 101049]|uniref:3-methyl-2-oxobutanoate hydroxymethyltransferase n=1 Tax=Arthrobacter sp. JSM 101049 TaxID=929097 RepID=UPI003566F1B8